MVSVAAITVFEMSASSSIGGIDHADQCGVNGHGLTTDHQNSNDPATNVRCSTPCQNGTCSASW